MTHVCPHGIDRMTTDCVICDALADEEAANAWTPEDARVERDWQAVRYMTEPVEDKPVKAIGG